MDKFSITSIAWPKEEDDKCLSIIAEKGFQGIEIAPSRVWDDFRKVPIADRTRYLKYVESFGIEICSMHSLFWGVKNAKIFGSEWEQRNVVDFFNDLIILANDLNIPRMILGSPSIRVRDNIGKDEAINIAAELLRPIAEFAYAQGTKILIEPLSMDETDFINNHIDGINLVDAVSSKGFGLHLDAKAMCSESDSIESIINDVDGMVEHFHVNENGLSSLRNPVLPHKQLADELNRIGYDGYISIEMKKLDRYEDEISIATDYVKNIYGRDVNEL